MIIYYKRIKMRKIYNSKKDHQKKVYVQPSIQEIGLILDKTKANGRNVNKDNTATPTTFSS